MDSWQNYHDTTTTTTTTTAGGDSTRHAREERRAGGTGPSTSQHPTKEAPNPQPNHAGLSAVLCETAAVHSGECSQARQTQVGRRETPVFRCETKAPDAKPASYV
jgi:hypothetical protein